MAEIKCLSCEVRGIVANPDDTEVVELLPVDKEGDLKKKGEDYLIYVCPACASSTICVLKKKVKPEPKKKAEAGG